MSSIRAAGWNVHHDTKPDQAMPTLGKIFSWGADLVFLQEINGDAEGIPKSMAKRFNVSYRSAGEFAIG